MKKVCDLNFNDGGNECGNVCEFKSCNHGWNGDVSMYQGDEEGLTCLLPTPVSASFNLGNIHSLKNIFS